MKKEELIHYLDDKIQQYEQMAEREDKAASEYGYTVDCRMTHLMNVHLYERLYTELDEIKGKVQLLQINMTNQSFINLVENKYKEAEMMKSANPCDYEKWLYYLTKMQAYEELLKDIGIMKGEQHDTKGSNSETAGGR